MIYKDFKEFLLDRLRILAFILFVLCLFLTDVSLNNIMAYGQNYKQGIFFDYSVRATSSFWFGFIFMVILFFAISFRSVYTRRSKIGFLDAFFGITGIIGLMITFAGGIIAFWHGSNTLIPFFSSNMTRVQFYHFGLALDIFSLLYFALTKPDSRISKRRKDRKSKKKKVKRKKK
ncbi:hypothetical protein GF386_03990 [Candidatus Pacearchaeota archaeon]|nr:hypothetical protein [Candidatus Pacearchaeota archaeon]MBD3283310.1 hypothetical protein [Candidatus Pacearchaeota archaeon]